MKNAMMGDKAQTPSGTEIAYHSRHRSFIYVHDEIKLQDCRRGIEHSLEKNIKISAPQVNKEYGRYSGSRIGILCDSCRILTCGIFNS